MQISKKKITIDLLLNLIATAIPIAALQLVIYPLIIKYDDSNAYGVMVTAVSLLTVVCNTLGNVLNNIRLLNHEKYESEQISGDFNVLLCLELLISMIITGVSSVFMFKGVSAWDILLIVMCGMLLNLYAYMIVSFRITLNYKAVVLNNVVLTVGYFGGFLLFLLCGKWQMVYIVAYSCSLIHIICTSNLIREPLKRTAHFKRICIDSMWLLLSGIMYSLLNYADRMIIYPMIGAEAVTIYYIASLFGKMVSMVVGPMNSVALSYIAKIQKLSDKIMGIILGLTFGIGVIGYFLCMTIGKLLLKYMYADYYGQVVVYMPVTTVTAMVMMAISVVFPFILKFCPMKWQVVIDTVALLCYVTLGILFYRYFGLYGFCVGVLIAFIIKLLVMIIIYYKGKTMIEDGVGEVRKGYEKE